MKRKKNAGLSDAVSDGEFRENAQLASRDDEKAFEEFEDNESEDNEPSRKPVLTEKELKVRRARRTKVAVAAFVLLLGIGVMGNWYYENSDFSAGVKPITSSDTKTLGEAEYVDGAAQQSDDSSGYFSEARVNRQKTRDEALEKLQEIVDGDSQSNDAKKVAAQKIADISSYIEIENKIETLVTAKGCENCLAVISADGKRVDVIVDVQELSDTVIMQVKDIAMKELGCSFKDVTVIQSK